MKGINFANGFVDQSLVLHPHNQDFGMTYTLPFRYLEGQAGNSPHFFQFLQDCWGVDPDFEAKKLALQEALCVTLFGLGPMYQRAVLLKGVAKSGKSQMLKIAQSLVPDDARSFVAPNDWADKFLPTQMHNKLINVCGELSEKKKIDGMRFGLANLASRRRLHSSRWRFRPSHLRQCVATACLSDPRHIKSVPYGCGIRLRTGALSCIQINDLHIDIYGSVPYRRSQEIRYLAAKNNREPYSA